MKRNRLQIISMISALIALWCAPAHAMAGAFPTIILIVPGAVVLFFAFIAIKMIAARIMLKIGWESSFTLALRTSAISTLIGLPVIAVVIGIIAAMLQIPVLWYVALIPIEGEMGPAWGPNVALAILCAISGLVAIWLDKRMAESSFARKPAWDEDGSVYGDPADAWAWTANSICYGIVILILLIITPK